MMLIKYLASSLRMKKYLNKHLQNNQKIKNKEASKLIKKHFKDFLK